MMLMFWGEIMRFPERERKGESERGREKERVRGRERNFNEAHDIRFWHVDCIFNECVSGCFAFVWNTRKNHNRTDNVNVVWPRNKKRTTRQLTLSVCVYCASTATAHFSSVTGLLTINLVLILTSMRFNLQYKPFEDTSFSYNLCVVHFYHSST